MRICIEKLQDGTYRVYDAASEQMPEDGQSQTETGSCATVDEALAKAKAMLDGGATQNSPEAMFEQPQAAAADMQAGFQKARGPQAGY